MEFLTRRRFFIIGLYPSLLRSMWKEFSTYYPSLSTVMVLDVLDVINCAPESASVRFLASLLAFQQP